MPALRGLARRRAVPRHRVRPLCRAHRDAREHRAGKEPEEPAHLVAHHSSDQGEPRRARLARRHSGVGADPRAARDSDELRQPARRPLGEPALRAAHLHGLFEPALREPGPRGAGAARLLARRLAGARGDGGAARRALRAAHAAHSAEARQVVARPRTIERYLARLIYGATGFVLIGFLALFAFFDLIGELGDLGKGAYDLRQVFTFVLLQAPAHAYELFPIVVLIGTLYVLAHLASNSEYTVMRGSGLSPARAAAALLKIGTAFVVLTFVIGEWMAPAADEVAQKTKMRALSSMIGQDLQSGLWFKDEGSFINVRESRDPKLLQGVRIYEFDPAYRLRKITFAERAEYRAKGLWDLYSVVATRFEPDGPHTLREAQGEWHTAVAPDLLNALIMKPERMSAWALHKYTEHLELNRQRTERYEIALWKK
ncbi:MAG: LPS export ABC transporter permease LptG, partial [Betaproteobacteria bacterium]